MDRGETSQLRMHRQSINEVLVVALCIEMEHARLQRGYLVDDPIPNGCGPSLLVPGFVPGGDAVTLGGVKVGERVNDVIIVRELRAHGKVDIAARRKSLGRVWPYNGTLLEVGKGMPSHPLHVHVLNLRLLARVDNREVVLDSGSRKVQAKCFESLQLFENIDLSSQLADIYLEYGDVVEDSCKLRLGEVIDGIERCGGLAEEPPELKGLHIQSRIFETSDVMRWKECFGNCMSASTRLGLFPISLPISLLHLHVEDVQRSCDVGGTVFLDTNDEGQPRHAM